MLPPERTEIHRYDNFGTDHWVVSSECVYLNDARIINGSEIGSPSDNGRRYTVAEVRKALALRDEFDTLFPKEARKTSVFGAVTATEGLGSF